MGVVDVTVACNTSKFGCPTSPQKGRFCPENFGRLEDNTCAHISKCPKNSGTRLLLEVIKSEQQRYP
ncbi:unnamed protein product, partial [Mesorhabditis belari]|uniref:Uncharacterized protein n=1 Tax=Mesorhabditis belari TaxID=2138241 RepID=A0AAF3EE25_9BILA